MANKGRPTLQKQRLIEKKLHEYFIEGYSEASTSHITGHNINTVSKYFRKWCQELIAFDKEEYHHQMESFRTRLRLTFDAHLQRLYKIQDDIDEELKNYKSENNGKIPHGKGMYKERVNIIGSIAEMFDAATAASILRPDWEINEQVKKDLKEQYRLRFEVDRLRKLVKSNN